jgi:signal peptidase I
MTKTIEPVAENSLYETIKTVFIAGLIALTVRSLAFEPFSIPSGSMIPTLLISDYLFVSKSAYGYSRYSFPLGLMPIEGRINSKPVQRGDIIVFRKPGHEGIDYIKRAIGLPGDRIQMRSGRLYINGKKIERDYIGDYEMTLPDGSRRTHKRYREILPEGVTHEILEYSDGAPLDNTDEYVVPKNHYFMMGDNRDGSQDSRVMSEVGYVPEENLVGRAERIFFSLKEGTRAFELWKWPTNLRYGRLFQKID